jgi:broad specificity phosphatase PhoE
VTIVHLLRHGEVYNPDRVLYGRLPGFQLSLRGLAQAELAAKFLATRPIGYVVSSPLERARQTAAPVAAAFGLEVATDDRLIEAENALQGQRVDNVARLIGDVRNWRHFGNPLKPSWGEPYEELAARMLGAALTAAAVVAELAPVDGRVPEAVCVSHQLPIYTLRRYLEGQRLYHDPRRRQCGLASVTTLTFIDQVAVDVEYFEPAGATARDGVSGA